MNVIQKILSDYYEVIEYSLKPRPVVLENIDKVIHLSVSYTHLDVYKRQEPERSIRTVPRILKAAALKAPTMQNAPLCPQCSSTAIRRLM